MTINDLHLNHHTKNEATLDTIQKDPIDGSKSSKPGKLALIKTETGYRTIRVDNIKEVWNDQLVEVFRDGELLVDYNWDQIVENAKI